MDRHGSGLLVRIDEVEHQRVHVTVEDDPDQLAITVDHGAAGVAADDVGGADEVEWRVELDSILALDPAPGQLEGSLLPWVSACLYVPPRVVAH